MMARRRWPSPALWATALVLGLPALADAQLFPRLPTWKRQRPACEAEPPIYKIYRQQYFGYYPTCWKRFPPGWGCLDNPERPNFAASLVQQPLPTKPEGGRTEEDILDGGMRAPGPEGELPEVPRGPSPFDEPMKPPTNPTPLPGAERPDDLPPRRNDAGLPPTTDNVEPAPPPIAEPAQNRAEVESSPPIAPASPLANPPAVEPLPPAPVGPGAMAPPPPTRAPQRRSMLASLFNWSRTAR